jgi:hypothetical protein
MLPATVMSGSAAKRREGSVVMSTTTGPRLTVGNKVGLVLAGLLGAGDFAAPVPAAIAATFLFPRAEPGNEADPFATEPMGPVAVGVAVVATIIGLATIAGVVLAWARGNRIAARVVAAARVVSVLITVPVFLLQGMPAWIFVLAAALVILNITTVILVLSRPGAAPLPD